MRLTRTCAIIGSILWATTALAETATSVPSGDQQVEDVLRKLSSSDENFDPKLVDLIYTETALERQVAIESIKASAAEKLMVRRVLATVRAHDGNDKHEKNADVQPPENPRSRKVKIDGDSATIVYSADGDFPEFVNYFRRVNGTWKQDLFHTLRARRPIGIDDLARWKAIQAAAEETARIYERGEERDVNKLHMVWTSQVTKALALRNSNIILPPAGRN